MTAHARGTFKVKTEMQSEHHAEGATLARMSLSEQFHGGLEGTGTGEMLSATIDLGGGVEGSAGYVAITQFRGSLDGRRGTFMFQHSGTMTRGTRQQSVAVVPDSGTGQLAGLAGRLAVEIGEGKYFYDFEYTLEGH